MFPLINRFMDDVYVSMLAYVDGDTSKPSTYWIATRTIDYHGWFGVCTKGTAIDLDADWLYTTENKSTEYPYPLRPFVTIPLNGIYFAESGSGTKSDPWSLRVGEKTNTDPVLQSVAYKEKGTDYITFNVRATDTDGDKLTYYVYTGTSKTNLTRKGTLSGQTQGSTVQLKASGLNEYTDYYYRVDVYDGSVTKQGTVSSSTIRTYCPGGTKEFIECTTCSGLGGYNEDTDCGTCSGKGKIEHYGLHSWVTENTKGPFNCPTCSQQTRYIQCDRCTRCELWNETRYYCSNCGYSGSNTPSGCYLGSDPCTDCGGDGVISEWVTCTSCNGEKGSWKTTECKHGKTEQHDKD